MLEDGSLLIDPSSKISLVEQEPFLLSDTVQGNITFGKGFNRNKFDEVSRMVCLDEDYHYLAQGQDTEIGEKGVNLSGGQRARVALARALYNESDIYLFDDPLSALDPRVAHTIMERAFVRYLAGRTRILVTHQLRVLSRVDRIIYLDQQKVKFCGTYGELLDSPTLDLA